jgi:hypothetical protein
VFSILDQLTEAENIKKELVTIQHPEGFKKYLIHGHEIPENNKTNITQNHAFKSSSNNNYQHASSYSYLMRSVKVNRRH